MLVKQRILAVILPLITIPCPPGAPIFLCPPQSSFCLPHQPTPYQPVYSSNGWVLQKVCTSCHPPMMAAPLRMLSVQPQPQWECLPLLEFQFCQLNLSSDWSVTVIEQKWYTVSPLNPQGILSKITSPKIQISMDN